MTITELGYFPYAESYSGTIFFKHLGPTLTEAMESANPVSNAELISEIQMRGHCRHYGSVVSKARNNKGDKA